MFPPENMESTHIYIILFNASIISIVLYENMERNDKGNTIVYQQKLEDNPPRFLA